MTRTADAKALEKAMHAVETALSRLGKLAAAPVWRLQAQSFKKARFVEFDPTTGFISIEMDGRALHFPLEAYCSAWLPRPDSAVYLALHHQPDSEAEIRLYGTDGKEHLLPVAEVHPVRVLRVTDSCELMFELLPEQSTIWAHPYPALAEAVRSGEMHVGTTLYGRIIQAGVEWYLIPELKKKVVQKEG